jgi:Acetyltransferases, including N-acetylases of ribosomal proteins
MDGMLKVPSEEYRLAPLSERHIAVLHQWNVEEAHFECYTCRPPEPRRSLEEYAERIRQEVLAKKLRIYILTEKENGDAPLGKITLFDWNPRNHSAEFGYYLPAESRGRGLGAVMLAEFLKISFPDDELKLNKLYATTSSNNLASVKLLEKFDFKLDGRLREHYWIGESRYDQLVYSVLRREWEE